MFREPEKYEHEKRPDGSTWTVVTKAWADWDERNAKIYKIKRKIFRIVFFWMIPIYKYLSQWEIRKVR